MPLASLSLSRVVAAVEATNHPFMRGPSTLGFLMSLPATCPLPPASISHLMAEITISHVAPDR